MDKNGNENCLDGWECPDCGNHDMFRVESRIFVEVYDSGTGNDDGHTEYDGASRCICGTCGKEANVAYFTQAIRPEYAEKKSETITIPRVDLDLLTQQRNLLEEIANLCDKGGEPSEEAESLLNLLDIIEEASRS